MFGSEIYTKSPRKGGTHINKCTTGTRGIESASGEWFTNYICLRKCNKGPPKTAQIGPSWPKWRSVFCYRNPDFVNGPFVALAKAKILAPSDPFLNFLFPSYGNFREGDPPTQQKVLPHLTVGALTDSNSPSARSALTLRARALRARAG